MCEGVSIGEALMLVHERPFGLEKLLAPRIGMTEDELLNTFHNRIAEA